MKRTMWLFAFLSVAITFWSNHARAQGKGHDYPPFSAVETFVRIVYDDRRFDSHDFVVDDTGKETRVEGHKITITYEAKNRDANTVSCLEVRRTVESQAQSVNAQILFEKSDNSLVVLRMERAGKPVWLEALCYHNGFHADYTIVEEQEFQPMTHLSQNELRSAIDNQGKAVLHINFAFDKAALQPDAAPIIQEIVGVLRSEPNLNLEVDGHTDGIGPDDYNQRLSEARATTVVASLTSAGIDAGRLKSAGFGASRPIAGNDTEQGRAENRRVELIRD